MKKQLAKADIEELNAKLEALGATDIFNKKDRMTLVEEDKTYYYKDDLCAMFVWEGKLIPTLKLIIQKNFLKTVTVDMGAIKFLVSGADVMRPGIVASEEFSKDAIVVVVDQTHKKPLCICQAMFSSADMMAMKTGKVLKNIHWVGDSIWTR